MVDIEMDMFDEYFHLSTIFEYISHKIIVDMKNMNEVSIKEIDK